MFIEMSYRDDIESKREEMIRVAQEYGLNSEKTIQCSQELDYMLNHYKRSLLNFNNDKKD